MSQLASLVEDMPEPTEPEYSVKYEANDFVWDKDRVIEFVTYLLHHPTTEFPLALELGFEYCRKKPEALPEFVKVISERLVFDEEDEPSGFARQDQLFQVLFQGVAENKLHITEAFLDLSKKFLAHSFHITKGVRKHAITFYQYPHPMNDAVILNRKRIWECLFELFPKYQKHILDSIENYHQGTYGYIPEILGYDLDVIVPFLTTKLNKSDFYSVKAVRSFKRIIDNENLGRTDYVEAARKFKSTQYDIYRKLSWNRVHGKEDYEFDDYEEFRKLKEKDLLQSFTFLSCADADDLLRTVSIMSKLGGESEWHLSQSLEVLIVANLENDVEVGLQFLDLLLKQNIDWLRPMYRVLGSVGALQDEYVQRVWVSICQAYGVNQSVWKLEFLSFLKPNHCTIARAKNVIHTIRQLSVSCQIPVGRLSSYEKVNYYDLKSQILYWVSRIPLVGSLKIAKPKPFLVALLEIVSHKIAHDDIKLTLPYNFFDDFSESLSSHKELLFKLYIQQSLIYAHFDHHKRGFEYLYRMNPKFLVDFVRGLYSEKRQLGRNDRLEIPFIWNNPVRMDSISVTADHLVGTTHYFGIGEHSLCILFNDLNTEQQIIAKQFLRDYISANCNSVLHLNAIFDVVRNTMKDYFPDALSHFLTINQDLEVFKSVHWRRSGRVLSGDASFGQLQVNDWKQVLEVIDQHHLKTELLQIREYVLQGISQGHRYAEHEKQQKFVEPEW